MKHNFRNFTFIIIPLFFIFLLFKDHNISKESIDASFKLWLNNLIPSIFPMIIISDILTNYNFGNIISFIFYKLFNQVFKLSYNATYILIMSLFIGTPANANLLKNYLDNNLINIKEADKLLYVIYFSNPLFLYGMLINVFNSILCFKIIISHYISNFIILFFIKNKYIANDNKKNNIETIPFSKLITYSSKKAIDILLAILGIVCFYNLIIFYIPDTFIFKGLLEITSGLTFLIRHNINNKVLWVIFINFGGFSIFSQIKSILEDTSLNFNNYFKGRILSIIICLLIVK